MSPLVLIALALITYISRAVAVVLLPRPSARFETILSRIPAPIFASLATATLLGDGGALASGPTLAASAGANTWPTALKSRVITSSGQARFWT